MLKRVLKSAPLRRAGAWLIGAYLRFALGSTRWTLEGDENLAPFVAQTPVVVAFWHECLPLMPALWLRVRGQNPARAGVALASRHADGVLIGDIMASFGVGRVLGSGVRADAAADKRGGRGGAAALMELARHLRRGDAVMITPDGPRGPRRKAFAGVLHLAALAGAPVLPVAARLRWGWELKTWDRMILPLPFGRGALVCLPTLQVARGQADHMLPALSQSLTAAADRAAVLCR
jgi:lysophospholipid acyltransferase (LPLAT)-like uncharacterized protein